jgi:hypothetical protein
MSGGAGYFWSCLVWQVGGREYKAERTLHLKHEDPNIEQKYSQMMIQNTHVASQSKETSNNLASLCIRQGAVTVLLFLA